MKDDKFIVPNSVGIWRLRQREGPPICYIVHRMDRYTTRAFNDAKSALKFVNWPKSTPTGQLIRDWFDQFTEDDAKAIAKPLDDFHQKIQVEGFGPEAHEDEENPVANTKMVT